MKNKHDLVLRAGRFLEALVRPDRPARRAVAVALDALVAEAAPYPV